MVKRIILFSIGIIFLVVSFPLSAKMAAELVYMGIMDSRYEIISLNQGYPPTSAVQTFNESEIEIKESLTSQETYVDQWGYKNGIGDLRLYIGGKEIDKLENYLIRLEDEGLERYLGEAAYITVNHKRKNETVFYILLKKTRETMKEMQNGNTAKVAPDDDFQYTFYRLDEEGELSMESFRLSERNALQTQLLNVGFMYYHSVGYFTDVWQGLPSLFFPFVYPFLTVIIGVALSIIYFPLRRGLKMRREK